MITYATQLCTKFVQVSNIFVLQSLYKIYSVLRTLWVHTLYLKEQMYSRLEAVRYHNGEGEF